MWQWAVAEAAVEAAGRAEAERAEAGLEGRVKVGAEAAEVDGLEAEREEAGAVVVGWRLLSRAEEVEEVGVGRRPKEAVAVEAEEADQRAAWMVEGAVEEVVGSWVEE